MQVETFKSILSKYRDFKKDLIKINDEITEILYEMTGVKGVRFDREPSGFNPNLVEQRRLELVDKYNEKLLEKEVAEANIKLIDLKLSKLDPKDKEIVLKIIADNVSYERMSGKAGYSRSGMWKKVQRDITKIL